MANKNCGTESLVKPEPVSSCNNPFSICLPFGGNLSMDGTCLKYTEPTSVPEDGEYSGVIVKNGCIQGVVSPSSPLYTANTCAPVPNPCDCDSGGSSDITPSTLDGNMLTLDSLNRPLVQLHYKAGDGIELSGKGTTASPLVVTCSVAAMSTILSGTPAILSVETEDEGVVISHVESKATTRTINGMTFDAYGHLYNYTEPERSTQYITASQIAGDGNITTSIDTTTNMVTVGLNESPVSAGSYLLGAYNFTVSKYGIVQKLEQSVSFPAGSYDFEKYKVTFNEYGTATDIAVIETNDVRHSVSKKIAVGTEEYSFTFSLWESSGLRVSLRSESIPECTVTIDNNIYEGEKIGTMFYDVLTSATFAEGSHTIVITPKSAFTKVAILDIILCTVV